MNFPPWAEGAPGWEAKRWWGVVYPSKLNSAFHLGPRWDRVEKKPWHVANPNLNLKKKYIRKSKNMFLNSPPFPQNHGTFPSVEFSTEMEDEGGLRTPKCWFLHFFLVWWEEPCVPLEAGNGDVKWQPWGLGVTGMASLTPQESLPPLRVNRAKIIVFFNQQMGRSVSRCFKRALKMKISNYYYYYYYNGCP